MKIAASMLQMSSSHLESSTREVHERLRLWHAAPPVRQMPEGTPVELSAAGRSAQSDEAAAIKAAREAVDKDPVLSLLRAMIAYLTGRPVAVFDAGVLDTAAAPEASSAPPAGGANPGVGVAYERQESTTETEATGFSAEGIVRTADGQVMRFSIDLQMSRSFRESANTRLQVGNTEKKDPLVINFGGNAAELGDRQFSIDLNADGSTETAHFVAAGSGFLVFDRNADGRITDGREMFGPTSGDGFAELADFDDDGNGWIDEGDATYSGLRVWTKDSGGDHLLTLAEAGVGAIGLGRIATPFDLKDAANASRGEIRSTGIYLREDGSAGTIQQIDLAV